MNLKDLKNVMPFKWRIQSCKYGKATCVAYIDARQVMDTLDEAVGAENWQTKFELIDSKLFCGIGIKFPDGWVWKFDTGTESNIEPDKGQVSDALKRAAVLWGCGRFLYSLDIITLKTVPYKSKDGKETEHPADDTGKILWNGDEITDYCNYKMAKNSQNSPSPALPLPKDSISPDEGKKNAVDLAKEFFQRKEEIRTQIADCVKSGLIAQSDIGLTIKIQYHKEKFDEITEEQAEDLLKRVNEFILLKGA